MPEKILALSTPPGPRRGPAGGGLRPLDGGESGPAWQRLRKKLRFSTWRSKWDLAVGGVVTSATLGLFGYFGRAELVAAWRSWWPWMLAAVVAGWVPWLARFLKYTWRAWQIRRNTRVLNHAIRPLRRILLHFPAAQLVGQPLPLSQQTDQRYQLLEKLQSVSARCVSTASW